MMKSTETAQTAELGMNEGEVKAELPKDDY